ncbi:MAG: hypothetical protein A2508_03715 [Candidatus Lambdaproteobacteria bacterium RIFOXYD12_FULL_49_8]|uniref:FCP1 homology domain-containing protein n=1 Tax=Candidatus Lambdaproteobacteria bacterium RIFOXYD2_FULL_50_16 TaxID=1817772 RepID=A0A1F6GAX1_9PROT|nr:MAG: hypothetical protein A2527_08760 [Candidatus Lambdaproteobacteria bacterium RIFOXYD2_FULL_50_16]OGG96836.1 MAG: hypothetical protein A2508_03715 [Candidatus Lambdaproteobacteria bacterium RIFOXYD12_FULL_49_8]
MKPTVLALDLEGTLFARQGRLIIPRPGLHDFLEFCFKQFERVVVYTLLSADSALMVVQSLVESGAAPKVFLEQFEYIEGPGGYKDLNSVENADEVWLVDDSPSVIHPEQRDRWIPIQSYRPPPQYSSFGETVAPIDSELSRVQSLLETRLLAK